MNSMISFFVSIVACLILFEYGALKGENCEGKFKRTIRAKEKASEKVRFAFVITK